MAKTKSQAVSQEVETPEKVVVSAVKTESKPKVYMNTDRLVTAPLKYTLDGVAQEVLLPPLGKYTLPEKAVNVSTYKTIKEV